MRPIYHLFQYTILCLLISIASANATCNKQKSNDESDFTILASNLRSDTIDILHYTINLNITDFSTYIINGGTTIRFTPRVNNVSTLSLDLLRMNIDSVKISGIKLTSTYTDTLLIVRLPASINIGDTSDITVWYHGKPQLDPSWGGFYFSGGSYAYNLGVGFKSNPHSFGRVWFPCFDNFVERSTYTFVIGTNNGKLAYCNGLLGADTVDVNGLRWRTWNLNQTIPAYLASVNVASYAQLNFNHNGINGTIPVILNALPSDTSNLRKSFKNLGNAIDCFENRFGPYMWPRVGYSLVPFNSGAMEHASNIAYPVIAANGLLTYESSLMAHELAHHWFGDLATCSTEGDMWLNEGWATYAQSLFTECLYGKSAYDASVLSNHDKVIHFAHLQDNSYLPLSGVPHQYTYGTTVYQKGADIAHTLRGYMGDSLFFVGLRHYFQQYKYSDVSSADFRDDLIATTGISNLTDFFNDWVYNPGFPQFSIDSVQSKPNGPNYDVTVFINQKLRGAPSYYTNVPVEISFFDSDWKRIIKRIFISGQHSNSSFTLPFNPVISAVDVDNKISDAISDEAKTIKTPGVFDYTMARCSLTVKTITDSAFVRIEHNWVAPDSIKNNINNYRISKLRYWKIDGIFPANFYASGRFYYDGRTNATSGSTYYWLDNDLAFPNGDSIILLYRRNAADDWHEWPYYTKTKIGTPIISKYGYVVADSIKPGEYTFAKGISSVLIGLSEIEAAAAPEIFVFPNPGRNQLTVEWSEATLPDPVTITIFDIEGRLIYSSSVSSERALIETIQWPNGTYNIHVTQKERSLGTKPVIIMH